MSESSNHPLLDEFDARRDQIVEGLHGVLGDHGAHTDQIDAVLEALGDALWAAHDATRRQEAGEELGRKARTQSRRSAKLVSALDALFELSNARR